MKTVVGSDLDLSANGFGHWTSTYQNMGRKLCVYYSTLYEIYTYMNYEVPPTLIKPILLLTVVVLHYTHHMKMMLCSDEYNQCLMEALIQQRLIFLMDRCYVI